MTRGKALVGLLIGVLVVSAMAMPANAAKPKSGEWFSFLSDEEDPSSIQFKVAKNRKKLKTLTIFWRCGGIHNYSNPPFPIGINKKKKFKVVGATNPPAGQSSKDFTLKGKFTGSKNGRFSMKLNGCGPATKGKLKFGG